MIEDSTTPEDVLPDNLVDGRISETRRETLQLINDRPGHRTEWYHHRLGLSDSYLPQFKHANPETFDTEKVRGSHGGELRWHLDSEMRDALISTGVIESDPTRDLANEVEEPSMRQERGNVTFEGVPADGTGDRPPLQTFDERPHQDTPSDGSNGELDEETREEAEELMDEMEDLSGQEDDQSTAIPDEEVYFVTLTEDDVMSILREADEDTARAVFRQLQQKDPYTDGGED